MNISEAIFPFVQVASDPAAYARKASEKSGKPFVGYLCSYTPEELIIAAGAVPFRVFGQSGQTPLADSHLQSYCCSFAKSALQDVLSSRLGFLSGAVFPHTCDTIQRLSDIWRLSAGLPFHVDLVFPVKTQGKTALEYTIAMLREGIGELEKGLAVKIDDADISDAVKLCNTIRKQLAKLYGFVARNPGLFGPEDMYAILRAGMVCDRTEFLNALTNFIDKVESVFSSEEESPGKRVILAGGLCNHPDIYRVLAEAGAYVVWDDLCTGTRYFEGLVQETGDPVEAIAARYLSRPVCPAKHAGTTARAKHIADLAQRHRADGVIFLMLKFCDPHAFDYPDIKKELDREGIPSFLLEIEATLPPEGQLRTRFESFVEML